jgi:hypothetical protein
MNSDPDFITTLFPLPPLATWAQNRPKIQASFFEHPSCQAEGRDRLLFIAGVKHPNCSREFCFFVGKVSKAGG